MTKVTWKRRSFLFFTIIFIITVICQFQTLAANVSLLNNNTMTTSTSFDISTDGEARVYVDYTGYADITTGATITITLEKRNLLFFWSDVNTDTIMVEGYRYDDIIYYQLEESGTYRCTVEYVISGTGGADDVITFKDTASY